VIPRALKVISYHHPSQFFYSIGLAVNHLKSIMMLLVAYLDM